MKFELCKQIDEWRAVASLAEAWIEIILTTTDEILILVASLAEAWIEIIVLFPFLISISVASLAEAWIEITLFGYMLFCGLRRLPRGGVD